MTLTIKRKYTELVKIGNVVIGGNNPVLIQSMTKVPTKDIKAILRQIKDLENVGCEIIRVAVKDIHSRMDIILVLDLSGTMRQLEKLWCAKESAIALALAATRYGDRVGLVTFSNRAEVVVDLTRSVYRLTRQAIDLDLHENAFTNIGHGLLTAYQLFSRRPKGDASQHIILISDGDATAPYPSPQRYALRQVAQIVRKGITISCICINEETADPDLMGKIARIGKGRIFLVEQEGLKTALLAEKEILNAGS